jgi:hypothetical protein
MDIGSIAEVVRPVWLRAMVVVVVKEVDNEGSMASYTR